MFATKNGFAISWLTQNRDVKIYYIIPSCVFGAPRDERSEFCVARG